MRPAICDGEVHVWVMSLRGALAASESLSEPERQRMERFVSVADRRRYGLAHVSARMILAEYLDRPPHQVEIRADALGKPRISGSGLEHSLARSGERAVLAVGWGRELGVDIERLHQLPDLEAFARSALTPRERDRVAHAGSRSRELLRLWTRKEALLKATGEGLRETTRQLDVLDDRPRPGWRLADLELGPGYAGAVAVDAAVSRIRQLEWQKKSRPAGDGPARASGEEVLL